MERRLDASSPSLAADEISDRHDLCYHHFFLIKPMIATPTLTPQEAEKRIASGTAVLIDVREPFEWESGVAKSANLLPLSDLTDGRSRWKQFLAQHHDKELIVYCRTGNRSGIAAGVLRAEGFQVSNAGSFGDWQNAGLPTHKP